MTSPPVQTWVPGIIVNGLPVTGAMDPLVTVTTVHQIERDTHPG